MPRARRRTGAGGEVLEAAFGAQVEGLLDLYGWRWFHAPDNRPVKASSGRTYVQAVRRGFPDYIALRGPELLVIELKGAKGRLGPGQAEWLEDWLTFADAVGGLAVEHRTIERLIGVKPTPVNTMARVEVHLWRPADLELINERLSRGRHRLEPAG